MFTAVELFDLGYRFARKFHLMRVNAMELKEHGPAPLILWPIRDGVDEWSLTELVKIGCNWERYTHDSERIAVRDVRFTTAHCTQFQRGNFQIGGGGPKYEDSYLAVIGPVFFYLPLPVEMLPLTTSYLGQSTQKIPS